MRQDGLGAAIRLEGKSMWLRTGCFIARRSILCGTLALTVSLAGRACEAAADSHEQAQPHTVQQPGGVASRISPPGDCHLIAVSPDGASIACSARLSLNDPLLSLAETLASAATPGSAESEALHTWVGAAVGGHLTIVNRNGEIVQRVLGGSVPDILPPGQWGTPPFDDIYLTGSTVGTEDGVWRFDGKFARIATGEFISLSPDQRWILLARSGGYLWMMTREGKDLRRVASRPAVDPTTTLIAGGSEYVCRALE